MIPNATQILQRITAETKLGNLRKMAKEIGKDHALAMELWSSGRFLPRQLAILVMDKKELSQAVIDELVEEMQAHPLSERVQLMDWLMANQLTKDKNTIALMQSWQHSTSPLQRRTFWYHQARLRWMGQTPPENSEELLRDIESDILHEETEVQWAMNFTAAWIGIYEKAYRERCIALGEKTRLYRDEKVSKGCTPNYLPEFIAMESKKRKV